MDHHGRRHGREALTHGDLAKDQKHWRAFREGEISQDWR